MAITKTVPPAHISLRIQIFNLWDPGLLSATLTRRFFGRRELRYPTSDPRREKPVARNEVEGGFKEDISQVQIHIISPQGKIKKCLLLMLTLIYP